MKPYTLHFPPPMIDRLKAASDRTGLSVSEIIRRAVDDYLERKARSLGLDAARTDDDATNRG